jgi:predicted Zn-dependent protease
MASDRRPSAQEIEELIDLVRRDPSSPAFIDLAEAYLNLGRPKDSITVCNQGLDVSPDNLEARVMLARAFAALHQWKEAQGELLRVVKIDRSSRMGFALLGEVLLRRNDYERAVPVLQHAQNLDPTSPQILSMLKRARANQPLDPPPAIPQPVPPRGETNYGLQIEQPKPAAARPVPASSPVAPTMALRPEPEMMAAPPQRAHKPTAPPPPQQPPEVRPRVISGAKPQNAAAASLRQSAAVGENYLNDLLTGGLLDVAGVRVPDSDFDLRPDRRWGRSTRRAFIFLFVVLVLGIGGGGTWYWWSEKQKSEAVARLQKDAQTAIGAGDFAGLELSLTKLKSALEKDPGNLLTFTYAAEAGGLESLLYGTETERVDRAIKAAAPDIKPGDPGARELLIGKAAVELSRLGTLEAPASTLAEVSKSLDDYLAKKDDKWVRWLKGRAQLAGGELKAAKATLKSAADGDDGVVVAMIDLADLLVDEGSLDEAFKLYDKALAKSKDHPLAVLGKSLARAESTVQANDAIDDLNVKLDKNFGPRVTAYRELALALAEFGTEDYAKSAEDLKKSTGNKSPTEPRFLARVAWAYYIRGDLKQAAETRGRIAWYGKGKAEDDPAVQLVDAGLLLASGLPDKALDVASKLQGVRPGMIRAYADIDLGKAKDAFDEADKIVQKAPDNLEAQILREQARMMNAGNDKDRNAAADALEHLARKAKSKIGRHALGMAYVAVNDPKDGQPQLEQAVADLGDDAPNPLAYRTYTALAQLALASNDIKTAGDDLDKALALDSGYFPTRALQAKVVLRNNDPDKALELLEPLLKETDVSPDVKLTLAEALITHKGASPKDKTDAQTILESIKDKVPPEEASRVAALIDPKLPAQLGLPKPPGEAPAPKAPTPKKRHR